MTVLANSSTDPQLSSALALDGVTDRLWLSDQSNGNILSCDVSTRKFNCQAEVNATFLLNLTAKSKLACFHYSLIGILITNFFLLSVESISVDELRVFWTLQDDLNVFYVLRDDPSSLKMFSFPYHKYRLLGLSPGQQPWSAAGEKAL